MDTSHGGAATVPQTSAAVAAFLNSKRAGGLKESTIGKLEYALRFLEKAFPGALPSSVEELEGHFAQLRARPSIKENTFFDLFRHTRQLYEFAKGRYGVANPFEIGDGGLQRPHPVKTSIQSFNEEQVRRLLTRNEGRPRELTVIKLMLATCMRPGECYNLRIGDLEESQGRNGEARFYLRLVGKTGQRRVPIPPELARDLRDLALGGEVLWRGRKGPLTRDGFKNMIKDAYVRAGFKGSTYQLRHTGASRWIANGGDGLTLKRLMGHTTTRMTDRYVDNDLEVVAEAQRRFNALAGYHGSFQPRLRLLDHDPGEGDGALAL